MIEVRKTFLIPKKHHIDAQGAARIQETPYPRRIPGFLACESNSRLNLLQERIVIAFTLNSLIGIRRAQPTQEALGFVDNDSSSLTLRIVITVPEKANRVF